MNIYDILILAVVALLLFLAIRSLRKGRGCCEGNCPKCGKKSPERGCPYCR